MKAKLYVLAAPSGAGKTTLVKELVARQPELRFSVSYTTRRKRENEEEGKDYFFVDEDEFERLREAGELLESANVFDNFYGTSKAQVQTHLAADRNVILEIDWQGARQVREAMPDCVTVFILPPSRSELEARLRGRQTDSEYVIRRRLRDALTDMAHWSEFDYCVINDDLEAAVGDLEAIFAGAGDESRVTDRVLRERIENILA
ncbi:MAG: guanylate kinase [Pseudomonadota bacterium]